MKELKYEVKRVIDTIEIAGNYVAYKEEIYINDTLTETKEGITLKQEINNVSLNQEIVKSKDFWLHKKEIRKLIREDFMSDKTMKAITDCLIRNPYTYIQQNGFTDIELLYMRWYNHYLYDLNQNKLPKAIYFDYIQGQISNAYFDLKEVLSILSQRTDIILETEGIVSIPYYNAEDDNDECIAFTWQPTDADWEKVKHEDDSTDLRNIILKDILGLTKKERDY